MIKYQLITPPTFLNELLGSPGKIQKAVMQKIKVLESNPVSEQGDIKKLKHTEQPLYRNKNRRLSLNLYLWKRMGKTDFHS